MELRQLRYFVAVAEAGNFSRAAAALHISQPPLSTQIKSLETEIGVQLFERSSRGATLTPAGRAYLDEVRTALARLEHARRQALLAGRCETGLLTVGFVSIADYSILPRALKSFRTAFPGVEVQLHELTTDAQIREIRAQRIDLGIGLAPVLELDLQFRRLLREALVLAIPSTHQVARSREPVDLRTMAKEGFVIPPRDIAPGLYDLTIAQCHSAGFAPRITQHARQMQTVIGLVASGMGIALVPDSVRNLKRPGVRYRTMRGTAALVELGVLSRRDDHNQIAMRFSAVLNSVADDGSR